MRYKPHQMVAAQLLRNQDTGRYLIVEFGMDGESTGCTPEFDTPDEANDCDVLHEDTERVYRHPAWHPVANLVRQ